MRWTSKSRYIYYLSLILYYGYKNSDYIAISLCIGINLKGWINGLYVIKSAARYQNVYTIVNNKSLIPTSTNYLLIK
jgi:hypothetical protein